MKRYFSIILAIAATVSAQIVPSTGNVRGPTSATDNAVARYDGTTGKLIQNSGVTIDDNGNLSASGDIIFATNNTFLKGKTSGGSQVNLLSLTSDATNITRFIAGVDAGGFQWTNQAQSSAWLALNSSGLYVTGNLSVSGSTISLPSTSGNVDLFGRLFALNVSNETRLYAGSSGISLYDHIGSGRLAQFTQSLLTLDKDTTVGGNLTVSGGTASINHTASAANILFKATGSQYAEINANSATGEFSINSGPSAGWGGFLTWKTDTTEKMRISNSGSLKLSAYGAGTLTTDSSGNVTATSDERAKNITGTFTKGLAEVVKLTPKTYTWKPETGLNTTDEVASLTAQDLIAAGIPEAVSTYRTVADLNDDGTPKLDAGGKPLTRRSDATYTVSDRAVIAALVNAVKELNAKVAALEAARK